MLTVLLTIPLLLAPEAGAEHAFDVRVSAGQKQISGGAFGSADTHWAGGVQTTVLTSRGAGVAFDVFASDATADRYQEIADESGGIRVVTAESSTRWHANTQELAVGPRVVLDGLVRTRLGVGVAAVRAYRSIRDDEGELWWDEGVGPGVWAEASLASRLGRSVDLGVALRASASRVPLRTFDPWMGAGEKTNVSAGGLQLSLTLGFGAGRQRSQ